MLVSVGSMRLLTGTPSNYLAYGSAWVHLTVDKRYDFFYVLGR